MIEVALNPNSTTRQDLLRNWARVFIEQQHIAFYPATFYPEHDEIVTIQVLDAIVDFRLYILSDAPVTYLEHTDDDEDEASLENAGGTVLSLPHVSLHLLWDALHLQTDIKSRLLDYAHTSRVMSRAGLNQSLINYNRLVLLHGPPGTGKTSLCKALAQRLSIQTESCIKLIEISCHNLFSKWFSESGKTVTRLFANISSMLEDDPHTFHVVLMDEVESLTASRQSSGSEPSDAMRVVNALLVQLDRLRKYPNVLLMTTSNLSDKVDSAFLDRVDILSYIGLPNDTACLEILKSTIAECQRVHLISKTINNKALQLDTISMDPKLLDADIDIQKAYYKLVNCASLAARNDQLATKEHRDNGMSARMLRKLPLLCFIKLQTQGVQVEQGVDLDQWLDTLRTVITDVHAQNAKDSL